MLSQRKFVSSSFLFGTYKGVDSLILPLATNHASTEVHFLLGSAVILS